MRVKTLLIFTALVSMVIGAVVVYLVLTVPNDIKAGALLRSARKEIAAGHNDKARDALTRLIQQYPRTDAAAAATAALASIAEHERQGLQASLDAVRRDAAAQKAQLAELQKRVETLAATPPPAPPVVQPQPKPKPKPKPAPKKTTRKKPRRR